MKKRTLVLCLTIALSAMMAISGTLAYLQDQDEAVDVMTLGNVYIDQHEYERVQNADGTYKTDTVDDKTSYVLKEFSQNKPLMPFVGSVTDGYDSTEVRLSQLGHNSRGGMEVFPANNVQDKFVVVENTGKSDAYVRTIVAFEAGSMPHNEFGQDPALIGYSFHFTWEETPLAELVEIDGNNYYVTEFVYKGAQDIQHPNGVLKPGDYTYNSLAQVYMNKTGTNEDVEKLDGNKNGTYDILVISQAVQTAGFADAKTALDTAFGKTADKAAEWFTGLRDTVYDGNEPENQPETLVIDPATRTITVKDADSLVYLSTLNEKWVELFSNGQGTEYSNYATVNGGKGTDYYYKWGWTIKLDANIDLAGHQIQPINLESWGYFDGQGYTIKNAKIVTDNTVVTQAGLFNGAGVAFKNLKLDNIHVTGSIVGGSTAGVLTGSGNAAIDNVTVSNSSVWGGKYTGGVVGYSYGSVTNCTVVNTSVKGGYKLGGIIGYICSSKEGSNVTGNTLTNCTVDGIGDNQYADGKSKYVVGKVVGNYNCNGTCNNNTITNMTTSAVDNIGEIEAGKAVQQ